MPLLCKPRPQPTAELRPVPPMPPIGGIPDDEDDEQETA